MDESTSKTIAKFEAKIAEHEQAIYKLRSAINQICEVEGIQPKYQLDDNLASAAPVAKSLGAIKPDEFYGKPLATAAKDALNTLRAAGKAPATIDTIYDVLCQGGFAFDSKSREASIQSLSISIGKNSYLFIKLPNGLIGVKDWYPDAAKRRAKDGNGKQSDATPTEPVPAVDEAQEGGQP